MIRWDRLWRRQTRRGGTMVPLPACRDCLSFRKDPSEIEAALPGLSALSSGFGSVRGDDGLCLTHDRFVTARASCTAFRRRPRPDEAPPRRA